MLPGAVAIPCAAFWRYFPATFPASTAFCVTSFDAATWQPLMMMSTPSVYFTKFAKISFEFSPKTPKSFTTQSSTARLVSALIVSMRIKATETKTARMSGILSTVINFVYHISKSFRIFGEKSPSAADMRVVNPGFSHSITLLAECALIYQESLYNQGLVTSLLMGGPLIHILFSVFVFSFSIYSTNRVSLTKHGALPCFW